MRKRLIAIVVGALTLLAVSAVSIWSGFAVSARTNSGLFGICGPYGNEPWITVVALLILGSPLVGAVAAIAVARRLWPSSRPKALRLPSDA